MGKSSLEPELLTVENYDTWAMDMRALLIRKYLHKYIDDDVIPPEERENDMRARAYIMSHVSAYLKTIIASLGNTSKAPTIQLPTSYPILRK